MGEGFKKSWRLTWNHYWKRRFVACRGSMGESQDILVVLYHQSPGHGPLREGDAEWIFDQNTFLEAMSVVLVVTETE